MTIFDLNISAALSDSGNFYCRIEKIFKNIKNNIMNKFVGTGVALITPFKEDLSVDEEALKKACQLSD